MCLYPQTGYYSSQVNPETGKRPITFTRGGSFSGVAIKLACGQCVECRLERARHWAVRCMHESKMHANNEFLTLTYSNEFLPDDGGLRKRDMQLFMKRLRKVHGAGVRFYGCGEYGSQTRRPHYHILLFNCFFDDKKFYKNSESGSPLYTSKGVQEIWPYGNNIIGDVTFDSASYVAGYVVDKVTGKNADDHYLSVDGVYLQPEFSLMSRRPGIGATFFQKHYKDIYRSDSVVMNGVEFTPPRFYDVLYEAIAPKRLVMLKRVRRRKSLLNKSDRTLARSRVKEVVMLRKQHLFAKGKAA